MKYYRRRRLGEAQHGKDHPREWALSGVWNDGKEAAVLRSSEEHHMQKEEQGRGSWEERARHAPGAAGRPMWLTSRDPGGLERKIWIREAGRDQTTPGPMGHSTDLKPTLCVMEKPIKNFKGHLLPDWSLVSSVSEL